MLNPSGVDFVLPRWIHSGMLEYLHADKSSFVDKPSFSGNTVGFVKGAPAYWRVLLPLADCARRSACISPEGSSLQNHRFDQRWGHSAMLTRPTVLACYGR